MNRLRYKKEIVQILKNDELEDVFSSLAVFPQHILINQLFSALCHPEAGVRWNGVKSLGYFVAKMASQNLEDGRIIMRRCLWALNDESGGIGWGIPEAMAEIMIHHDMLRNEYLHMLISYMREDGDELFADGNYLELPMLQRGLLWGVGRLCREFPEEMRKRGVYPDILAYLQSEDVSVVGYAVLALGYLGEPAAAAYIQKLAGSTKNVRLQSGTGERDIPLGAVAEKALNILAIRTFDTKTTA